MTALERAFAEAAKLPEDEQEALAALILEEVSRQRRQRKAFATSSDRLAGLAEECAKLDLAEEQAMAEEGHWK
ncbi:MAG: hypothetical protein HYX92_15345 [Chloroflexi bacterium]|nr:hypothetical protein [Chloroflexota bacterium]